MIKIICWNIRGINSRGTSAYLSLILSEHKPDILVLLEPMIDNSHIEKFPRTIHFDFSAHGGHLNDKLWIFWKSHVTISNFNWYTQHVSCVVDSNNASDSIHCSFVYARCTRRERILFLDDLISQADSMIDPCLG